MSPTKSYPTGLNVKYRSQGMCSAKISSLRVTWERVASATRQRTKQNRPQAMVKTTRKAAVLLPKSVLPGLGARSACVTALVFGMVDSKMIAIHAGSRR